MTLKVAIMQPTYLPWIGYFDLMDQCDLFIFLDSVQFDKRSWQQRNRIKSQKGEEPLTVPVFSKGKFDQKINEVEIDHTSRFSDKHLKTIQHAYAKAPFFNEYFEDLSKIFSKKQPLLVDLNISLIIWFKEKIGIKTKLVRSSQIGGNGSKVELLVSLCKEVGATHYISPPGSKNYIDENNLFISNGITLSYHSYQHPQYAQLHGDFLPYMSILDLLFNEGSNTLSIIRSKLHPPHENHFKSDINDIGRIL